MDAVFEAGPFVSPQKTPGPGLDYAWHMQALCQKTGG